MQMKFKTMLSILFFILFQQQCFSLSIGTIAEPPGNFEDKDGNITGLSVDFVKEIQKRVNNNSPIQMLPGTRLIYNSLKKKDYVVFSLSKTKDREDKYHWISLVMRKPLVLFAKRGSNYNIKNLEDARKVESIGVLRGTVQHDFLIANNFNNIDPVAHHLHNLKKLMLGRISLMYHTM